MLIYNVTLKIDNQVHDDWLTWMKSKHIPDVMATGCFKDSKIFKLLYQDEQDGKTYAIQYTVSDEKALNNYTKNFAPKLQEEHTNRYKDKFVAFRTIMEVA